MEHLDVSLLAINTYGSRTDSGLVAEIIVHFISHGEYCFTASLVDRKYGCLGCFER